MTATWESPRVGRTGRPDGTALAIPREAFSYAESRSSLAALGRLRECGARRRRRDSRRKTTRETDAQCRRTRSENGMANPSQPHEFMAPVVPVNRTRLFE
jgi:hypothetical protein